MVFSREVGPLKIATFNINNVNKRLHNLTAWLVTAQPDVVCLQELKVEQRAFRQVAFVILAIAESGSANVPGTASRSSRGSAIRC